MAYKYNSRSWYGARRAYSRGRMSMAKRATEAAFRRGVKAGARRKARPARRMYFYR